MKVIQFFYQSLLQKKYWLLYGMFFTCSFSTVCAQDCTQSGVVVDGEWFGAGTCGNVVLNTKSVELYLVDSLPQEIDLGQTISFDYEIVDSSFCAGLPLIRFTCVEFLQLIPDCQADFVYTSNALIFGDSFSFQPLIVDSTQQYFWSFGDGTEATGVQVNHIYQRSGTYEVCLTVRGIAGCENTKCYQIIAGVPIVSACDFAVEKEVQGDSFRLEVFNTTDFGPYHPDKVAWYEYETGKLLGDTPVISWQPANNNTSVTICADLEVTFADSGFCSGVVCEVILLETPAGGNDGCEAFFFYLPTADASAIELYDISSGDIAVARWHMGDGTVLTDPDMPLVYKYQQPGLYEICLEIEDETGQCVDDFCLPVFTVGGGEICEFNDCVLPGDANKDGTVNVFDVLPIGLGYQAIGAVRPNAVVEPILQAAFDWEDNLKILNYKHFDCDGDGLVADADFSVVEKNYQPLVGTPLQNNKMGLPVNLSFTEDTIFLSENVTFTATLTLGNDEQPFTGLHGFALVADYDTSLMRPISVTTGAVFNSEDIEVVSKNNKEYEQLGIAISKTNQSGVNGSGEGAHLGFIVVGDIIGGRVMEAELEIKDILLLDEQGDTIPVNVLNQRPSVVIMPAEEKTVAASEVESTVKFDVFPNPANEEVIILRTGVTNHTAEIELFDLMGRSIFYDATSIRKKVLNTAALPAGVYWLTLTTVDGMGVQQIVIE